MVHLYTGNGKGKTTAALGLGLRFAGSGGRVLLIQFLKSSDSSEIAAVRLVAGIEVYNSESPHGFYYTLSETQKASLQGEIEAEFSKAQEAASGSCGLLILDEVLDAVNLGLIYEAKLLELLKSARCEVVLTGRNPSARIIEAADYFTEFVCKKHPYDKGVLARRGIEY
ncbi:Cob(I)yrinic acid a,c-diamide adenosyltransferase [bioreactor metagenome]|uniref:Cob(I)yrinic acid a,c-diamide adenosyltransferase n=1 Tax=bioreactor metagenome TaxID=1076179 RepID=A0A645BH79_9ZZZZ